MVHISRLTHLPIFVCLPISLPLAAEEIYVVSIGAFAGRGFSDLVRELFEQHGVILLGISEDRRVVLHPGAGYIITEVNGRCRGMGWGFGGLHHRTTADGALGVEKRVHLFPRLLLLRSRPVQTLLPLRTSLKKDSRQTQPHHHHDSNVVVAEKLKWVATAVAESRTIRHW